MNETPTRLQFNYFEDRTLELRDQWANCAIAPGHVWTRSGPNEDSDSRPFDIKDQNDSRGKAKPGCKKPDVSRAAHEKIASDLAALLDLPVPPVTLYQLTGDLPTDPKTKQHGEPFICVSAWAFEGCDQWGKHKNVITEDEKASTIIPLSGVWVFESWISADDRGYEKHILVAPNGQPPLKIACVDYAFSLSKSWAYLKQPPPKGAKHKPLGPVGWRMPIEQAKRDPAAVKEIADRISSFSNKTISDIVTRIDAGWLPPDRGQLILENLLERRDNIHRIVGMPRS